MEIETMQNTNETPDRRIPFDQYVAEMQGFLTKQFGLKAGSGGIDMARDYYARGRSPEYCAFAIARYARIRIEP